MDNITESQLKEGTQVVFVLPRSLPTQNIAGAQVQFGFIVGQALETVTDRTLALVRFFVLDKYRKWAGEVSIIYFVNLEHLYPWQFTEQEKVDTIIADLKKKEA